MKVALVYDRVNKWGGAERVLLALHRLFPKSPLYTSVYHQKKASWAKVFKVKTSFLQTFPFAPNSHELYAALMPLAFESFDFSKYDVVISVTSEAAKGIQTKGKTIHICYCLTPTRYLWSGYEDYFTNLLFKIISYPIVWYLRSWDKTAAQRPDVFVAISKEVKKRIKKYYARSSVVIYPPVTLSSTNRHLTIYNDRVKLLNGYFLVVSRLVAYKRIDLAIRACNKLKLPLKIIGTGSEETYLKAIAGPTIEFLGNLTDDQLVSYYKGCLSLIFPGKEDFGLVILEAQWFGKPVIAYKGAGALETIIEGKTGEFFYPQSAKALIKTIKKFRKKEYHAKECRKQAKKFSEERFREELLRIAKMKEHKKLLI